MTAPGQHLAQTALAVSCGVATILRITDPESAATPNSAISAEQASDLRFLALAALDLLRDSCIAYSD